MGTTYTAAKLGPCMILNGAISLPSSDDVGGKYSSPLVRNDIYQEHCLRITYTHGNILRAECGE